MAIPAPEYRERLLEQGCDEGLADVVLALVEAARDDAEAEVIIKAGEQIAHSEQRLNGRLDQHAEQNDRQFRAISSEIREAAIETTRTLTAQIEQRTAQLLQSAAEQRAETERQFSQVRSELADLRIESERRHAEQEKANERQFTEMRVENERQFAELRIENERGRRENAEAFSKTQNRLSYIAIGIATLIIGAAAAIIAAFAFIA